MDTKERDSHLPQSFLLGLWAKTCLKTKKVKGCHPEADLVENVAQGPCALVSLELFLS